MARPSKLTDERTEKICRAVKAGNYPGIAARSAGISEATFYRWMEEGRAADSGPHHDFYEAVKRAEAEGEALAVAWISKAMPVEWRAAMAVLERRFGERWGRREHPEQAIHDERPVVDLTKLSDREIKTLEKINARFT
jgi:transposase